MKNLLLLAIFSFMISGVAFAQNNGNKQELPNSNAGVIFKETVWNFKKVAYGSDVSHSFVFTNNTKAPVTISEVVPGCGCTTTDYTKGPIMPGKSGNISIRYDSTREGYFAKTVNVRIGDQSTILSFLGTVGKKPTDQNTPVQNGSPSSH